MSIGAVKTSLLISNSCGIFSQRILKNFSPDSIGLKILFCCFSTLLPINLLKFEWKYISELEKFFFFNADNPICGLFPLPSNQIAVGITPGEEVIPGIYIKTKLLSLSP